MPTKEELQDGFKIGDWEVLPAQGVLRCGDREETPEPLVFKLLMALATRDGNVASKEDLVTEVWDGYPVGDDSITRCVAQLRKHLGEQGKTYVKTLTKRGYRLDEKISFSAPEPPQPPPQDGPPPRWTRRSRLIVTAAIVVMLGIVFWPSCGGRVESIAVLPFENLSVDEADQYRVSGFMVELVQTLHKLPGISVIPGRVTYANREVSEIGKIFDVDAILFGELQRVGSEIKITYRIVRACNGKVIAAGELGGQVGEEFALQEQMAYQVRSELTGDAGQQLLSQQRHPNSDAYDRYMRGLFLLERRGLQENFDMAIDLFEQAIEIDPAYGAPYLSLASAYVLLYDYANEPLAESIQRALDVIERGIEQDDSIEDAAAEIIGYAHHKQRQWEEAEQSYIRATTGEVVDSNAFNWYSLMLGGVGRLDDALEQILIAQKLDPTSVIINTRLGMIYTWLGENKNAAEYLDRASQLDASWDMHMFGRAILLAREEKLNEAASMFDAGVTLAGGTSDWLGPFFEAMKDSTKVRTAVVAINSAFEDPVMDPRIKIIVLTVLGETDEAMNVAMTLANSDVFFEVDFLFAPELQLLRQHPGFMVLMKELGIVDYWEANQCVWKDDRVHCPS